MANAPLSLTYTPPLPVLPSWLSASLVPTQTTTATYTYATLLPDGTPTEVVDSIVLTLYRTDIIELPLTVDAEVTVWPYTDRGGTGPEIGSVLGGTGFVTIGLAGSASPAATTTPTAVSTSTSPAASLPAQAAAAEASSSSSPSSSSGAAHDSSQRPSSTRQTYPITSSTHSFSVSSSVAIAASWAGSASATGESPVQTDGADTASSVILSSSPTTAATSGSLAQSAVSALSTPSSVPIESLPDSSLASYAAVEKAGDSASAELTTVSSTLPNGMTSSLVSTITPGPSSVTAAPSPSSLSFTHPLPQLKVASSHLTPGQLAGIALGSLAYVVLLLGCCLCCLRRRRRHAAESSQWAFVRAGSGDGADGHEKPPRRFAYAGIFGRTRRDGYSTTAADGRDEEKAGLTRAEQGEQYTPLPLTDSPRPRPLDASHRSASSASSILFTSATPLLSPYPSSEAYGWWAAAGATLNLAGLAARRSIGQYSSATNSPDVRDRGDGWLGPLPGLMEEELSSPLFDLGPSAMGRGVGGGSGMDDSRRDANALAPGRGGMAASETMGSQTDRSYSQPKLGRRKPAPEFATEDVLEIKLPTPPAATHSPPLDPSSYHVSSGDGTPSIYSQVQSPEMSLSPSMPSSSGYSQTLTGLLSGLGMATFLGGAGGKKKTSADAQEALSDDEHESFLLPPASSQRPISIGAVHSPAIHHGVAGHFSRHASEQGELHSPLSTHHPSNASSEASPGSRHRQATSETFSGDEGQTNANSRRQVVSHISDLSDMYGGTSSRGHSNETSSGGSRSQQSHSTGHSQSPRLPRRNTMGRPEDVAGLQSLKSSHERHRTGSSGKASSKKSSHAAAKDSSNGSS